MTLGEGLEKKVEEENVNVEEKIKDIFAEQLDRDRLEIENGALIVDDLGADSLDVVDIVSIVEEEFNVKIPEDDFGNLRTIGDVVEKVKDLLGQ